MFGNRNLLAGLVDPVHQLETSSFELRSRDQHDLTISLTSLEVKRTQLQGDITSEMILIRTERCLAFPLGSLRIRPQHFLYFFPLPQVQGSFRPTFEPLQRAGTGVHVDFEEACAVLESCEAEGLFHRPQ